MYSSRDRWEIRSQDLLHSRKLDRAMIVHGPERGLKRGYPAFLRIGMASRSGDPRSARNSA